MTRNGLEQGARVGTMGEGSHGPTASSHEPVASASHTPGPWFVAGGNALRVWYRVLLNGRTEKRVIASVSDGLPESMANARLIAASPDLLAVLKSVRDDVMHSVFGGREARLQALDAAIAKAEVK